MRGTGGFWNSRFWNLRLWAEHFWYERISTGEPRRIFYADKIFTFRAMKTFTFPVLPRVYNFVATKQYVFPILPKTFIFKAAKQFIFSGGTMTNPSYFEKSKDEVYTIAAEFSGQLPFSATISSGTLSAVKLDDNSDASTTVWNSTTATISGTQVRGKIQGGKPGVKYRLLFHAVLNNGEILEEFLTMLVRTPA